MVSRDYLLYLLLDMFIPLLPMYPPFIGIPLLQCINLCVVHGVMKGNWVT